MPVGWQPTKSSNRLAVTILSWMSHGVCVCSVAPYSRLHDCTIFVAQATRTSPLGVFVAIFVSFRNTRDLSHTLYDLIECSCMIKAILSRSSQGRCHESRNRSSSAPSERQKTMPRVESKGVS